MDDFDEVPAGTGLIRIEGKERQLSFGRFRVKVLEGPYKGQEEISAGAEFSIGTAPGNQLVLRDATVSRHHCTINAIARGYLLKDIGSTNGTWLGDYRVEAAYLKAGARMRVGMTWLVFEPLGEQIHEALSEENHFGGIFGSSAAMRRIFALLPRVAASDSTVLLLGETGTGKGLFAQAIHVNSKRHAGPFVVVDCGAIPPTLIESELLGHERGAFTGAHALRAGAFETARGGTIFLDEIGELPLDIQPKLLRALDERIIKRVGGTDPIRLDVRVIAATNRDLRAEVNRGTFRSDLFYRLNTVTITIPPLRKRPTDVPLLIEHFYKRFSPAGSSAKPPETLVQSFSRREWPGNVRELRGAVEYAVLMGGWEGTTPSVPPGAQSSETEESGGTAGLSFRAAKEIAIAKWERQFVRELMRMHGGNLSRAARAARTDRNHLRELVRRHGIDTVDE